MLPEKLNGFFWHWQEYEDDGKHPEIAKRLRSFERRYTRRDLASRFRRYVVDVDWMEWDEDFGERHNKAKNRAKIIVDASGSPYRPASREVRHAAPPCANEKCSCAMAFRRRGTRMIGRDALTKITLETKHQVCLHGYLSAVRATPDFYLSTVRGFLDRESTAWLGATIALRSDYDDGLFVQCQDALEKEDDRPAAFRSVAVWEGDRNSSTRKNGTSAPPLNEHNAQESLFLLVELLDSVPFNDSSLFNSDFVFGVRNRIRSGRGTSGRNAWLPLEECLLETGRVGCESCTSSVGCFAYRNGQSLPLEL